MIRVDCRILIEKRAFVKHKPMPQWDLPLVLQPPLRTIITNLTQVPSIKNRASLSSQSLHPV